MRTNGRKLIVGMILAAAIAVGGMRMVSAQVPATPTPLNVIDWGVFTAPSQRAQLQFNSMGIVRRVAVKESDTIKKGDLLLEQDDDIEQAELERLQHEATSEARIDFYREDYNVKKFKLERMMKPEALKGFAASELEEAKAELAKAEKQIEVAMLDHAGDVTKAKQQKFKVDKMKLYSTFDGRIESIGSWEGELASMDKDKPAIIIVKNDPCYVVINMLDSRQVAKLKIGDLFQVRYPDETQWREAKVSYIAPVANQGVHTQQVKLELPNPENRDTGLPIQVMLPPKIVPAAGTSPINAALNNR